MIYSRLLTLSAIIIFNFLAFAAHAESINVYGSTLHPQSPGVIKSVLHPPTDITVINASTAYFYAVVPNSPVNDYINPGFNDHIYNYDPSIQYTYLVLQDVYRNTFYAANVCRLAIVTVYGSIGNYRINYDDDLCH